jgi:hypothetical protein
LTDQLPTGHSGSLFSNSLNVSLAEEFDLTAPSFTTEDEEEEEYLPSETSTTTSGSMSEQNESINALIQASEEDEENTYIKTFDGASNWDAFNPLIKDYLLGVLPQTEDEQIENEKLVSFFFIDKGENFTDKYIQDKFSDMYDASSVGVVLSTNYLLSCLGLMICGYQSQLFVLHEKRRLFRVSSDRIKFRVLGLTIEAMNRIIDYCIVTGSRMERLRYTSKVIYRKAATAGPILIAFAHCIDSIIEVVLNYVVEAARTDKLLEFRNKIKTPVQVINILAELLGCDDLSKAIELNRLPESWDLLNGLFSRCILLESADEKLYNLVRLILKNTADQWFEKLENFIGFGKQVNLFWSNLEENVTKDFFVNITDELGINLFEVEERKVPNFFSLDLAKRSVNIMNCLLLLANYSSENVMHHLEAIDKVKLRWGGADLQSEILRYHDDIRNILQRLLSLPTAEVVVPEQVIERFITGVDVEDDPFQQQRLFDTLTVMNDVTPFFERLSLNNLVLSSQETINTKNTLKQICVDLFSAGQTDKVLIRTPLAALTNVSVSELVNIQSWALNILTLEIVFNQGSRRLLDHMVLVKEIMLLGSGQFVFDLEEVLFGPTVGSAFKRSLRIGGDRGDRGWPPSSMEVSQGFSQCIDNAISAANVDPQVSALDYMSIGFAPARVTATNGNTDDSIDHYGLYATDLFYIIYNPPDPLSVIITKQIRKQYNRLFARKLQLMHVRHALKTMALRKPLADVDGELVRPFCALGIFFVNTLAEHYSFSVTTKIWQPWERYLREKVFRSTMSVGPIDLVAREGREEGTNDEVVNLNELIQKHHKTAGLLAMSIFQTLTTVRIADTIDGVLTYILRVARACGHQQQGSTVFLGDLGMLRQRIDRVVDILEEYIETADEPTVRELTEQLQAKLTIIN